MYQGVRTDKNSIGYWIALGSIGLLVLYVGFSTSARALPSASLGGVALHGATPIAASTLHRPLVGDQSLRGEIDLSRTQKRGDQLTVELADGRKAILTLDPIIEQAAQDILAVSGANRGAIAALDRDGRILALAGAGAKKKALNYRLPTSVWAPAASIFKLVTSAALLEAGVKPSHRICYHGGFRSLDKSHLTDNAALDGDCHDLSYGLSRSQNAIIAKLSVRFLNRKRLSSVADRLGFSSAPMFALDTERSRYKLPTEKLEFARVAAGFWSSEISVLGAAVTTATIARRGLSITPQIVSRVEGRHNVQRVLAVPGKRVLKRSVAKALGEMMVATCEVGTAKRGFRDLKGRKFLSGTKVAGKTGSLSVERPNYQGYSWFVGYAPADDPAVIVAVLLANPLKWRLKAHTAARMLFEKALPRVKATERVAQKDLLN